MPEVAAKRSQTGESSRRITGACFNPTWSPDGKQLACATEAVAFTPTSRGRMSSLLVVDVDSGAERRLLENDAVQPDWSPNGYRVAYWGMVGESAQRDLFTIDPNAEKPVETVVRVPNMTSRAFFTPTHRNQGDLYDRRNVWGG